MRTGNSSGAFFTGHFKSILNHLKAARAGNKPAAEGDVVGEHMLNATICVFNIFSYNGNVNWDPCLGEYGIHTGKGLENSFVGVGIPGFPSSYVNAFNTF